MKKFEFQKHRNYNKNYKTLIRFLVYALVFGVLVYLFTKEGNDTSVQGNENEILDFDIETITE